MNKNYIPALTWNWLTPVYDFVLRFIMREQVFKQLLVNQINPQPGDKILDLGCGTGTLTLMIQKQQPDADLIGLDGDEKVKKKPARNRCKPALPRFDGKKVLHLIFLIRKNLLNLWPHAWSYTIWPFPTNAKTLKRFFEY